MCLLIIIELKSTINHNRKSLQALDDGLKWVSKYINKLNTFSSIIHIRGYISEEKCIVGQRHLACRRELAEGEHSFRARC